MKLATILGTAALTLAAAGVSYTVFGARDAEASEPVSAVSCSAEADFSGDYLFGTYGVANNSNGTGSRARNLHCHVPAVIRTAYSGQVFIDGYDGNNEQSGQVTGRVCLTSWAGGTTCQQPAFITFNTETGWFSGRALDATNQSFLRDSTKLDWYADLVISIPRQGISDSIISGFQTH